METDFCPENLKWCNLVEFALRHFYFLLVIRVLFQLWCSTNTLCICETVVLGDVPSSSSVSHYICISPWSESVFLFTASLFFTLEIFHPTSVASRLVFAFVSLPDSNILLCLLLTFLPFCFPSCLFVVCGAARRCLTCPDILNSLSFCPTPVHAQFF